MTSDLRFTGERFVPGLTNYRMTTSHEHRYQLALPLAKERDVLDFGCGAGYGAQLLAEVARTVTAFDPDEETIKHVRHAIQGHNLLFTSQLDDLVKRSGSFDLAVCFEVLEHVRNPSVILGPITEMLTGDGILLLSTPNKEKYQDIRQNNNPFHVHEYYREELQEVLESYFSNVIIYGQDFVATSVIFPLSNASNDARLSGPGMQLAPSSDGFLAVCSDSPVASTLSSFFLPDALIESDDIVDGLRRSETNTLLHEMNAERDAAQKVLDGWEADVERLNKHIHSLEAHLKSKTDLGVRVSTKAEQPRVTGRGLLRTVVRPLLRALGAGRRGKI